MIACRRRVELDDMIPTITAPAVLAVIQSEDGEIELGRWIELAPIAPVEAVVRHIDRDQIASFGDRDHIIADVRLEVDLYFVFEHTAFACEPDRRLPDRLIEEGIRSLAGYGGIFRRNVEYKGKIPQVALILGPAAGGASYSPALMDAIFLSKKHARMFLTGPDVTKKVTFEEHTAEELGGWRLHMRESGVAHYAYDDEKSCIEGVRRYLSYYSDSSAEIMCGDQSALSAILPEESRKPYDMHRIIETIFDSGSIMEERAEYAQNAITALARLDGRTVGIVADNPMHIAGSLDINASYKISSFIDFCSGAGFPVITFVDVPAFMPGIGQESGGIIRHGASIIRSYVSASVPLLTVIVRKAYGGAYIAMGSKSLGADFVYAWPSAEIAVMGKDGAKEILRKKHPDADEAELKNYLPGMDPWSAENALQVDEVILPEETRERLTTALRALS